MKVNIDGVITKEWRTDTNCQMLTMVEVYQLCGIIVVKLLDDVVDKRLKGVKYFVSTIHL